jgi:hypothetical protein
MHVMLAQIYSLMVLFCARDAQITRLTARARTTASVKELTLEEDMLDFIDSTIDRKYEIVGLNPPPPTVKDALSAPPKLSTLRNSTP